MIAKHDDALEPPSAAASYALWDAFWSLEVCGRSAMDAAIQDSRDGDLVTEWALQYPRGNRTHGSLPIVGQAILEDFLITERSTIRIATQQAGQCILF